jgi:hypothetical protein
MERDWWPRPNEDVPLRRPDALLMADVNSYMITLKRGEQGAGS